MRFCNITRVDPHENNIQKIYVKLSDENNTNFIYKQISLNLSSIKNLDQNLLKFKIILIFLIKIIYLLKQTHFTFIYIYIKDKEMHHHSNIETEYNTLDIYTF